MANASEAQSVVFELFQDLEGFNLNDYKPLADPSAGLSAIEAFLRTAAEEDGKRLTRSVDGILELLAAGGGCEVRFVLDRDQAVANDELELMGLDHPVVAGYLARFRELPSEELGIVVRTTLDRPAVLTLWHVTAQMERGQNVTAVVSIAADQAGHRLPLLERRVDEVFGWPPAVDRRGFFTDKLGPTIEPLLHREVVHRGLVRDGQSYQAELIGWVEAV